PKSAPSQPKWCTTPAIQTVCRTTLFWINRLLCAQLVLAVLLATLHELWIPESAIWSIWTSRRFCAVKLIDTARQRLASVPVPPAGTGRGRCQLNSTYSVRVQAYSV